MKYRVRRMRERETVQMTKRMVEIMQKKASKHQYRKAKKNQEDFEPVTECIFVVAIFEREIL